MVSPVGDPVGPAILLGPPRGALGAQRGAGGGGARVAAGPPPVAVEVGPLRPSLPLAPVERLESPGTTAGCSGRPLLLAPPLSDAQGALQLVGGEGRAGLVGAHLAGGGRDGHGRAGGRGGGLVVAAHHHVRVLQGVKTITTIVRATDLVVGVNSLSLIKQLPSLQIKQLCHLIKQLRRFLKQLPCFVKQLCHFLKKIHHKVT